MHTQRKFPKRTPHSKRSPTQPRRLPETPSGDHPLRHASDISHWFKKNRRALCLDRLEEVIDNSTAELRYILKPIIIARIPSCVVFDPTISALFSLVLAFTSSTTFVSTVGEYLTATAIDMFVLDLLSDHMVNSLLRADVSTKRRNSSSIRGHAGMNWYQLEVCKLQLVEIVAQVYCRPERRRDSFDALIIIQID